MKRPFPMLGGRMDLDPGERPRDERDRARQQRHFGCVQGVGHAVGEQRLDARPGRDDLERLHAARRGIAVARDGDVPAQLLCDPRHGVRCRAWRKRSGPSPIPNNAHTPDWGCGGVKVLRRSRPGRATTLEPDLRGREEGLRYVALARVGHDRDDPLAGILGAGRHLQARPQRRAAGDPGEQALAPRARPRPFGWRRRR